MEPLAAAGYQWLARIEVLEMLLAERVDIVVDLAAVPALLPLWKC